MKICLVSAAYFPYSSGVAIHVHNLAKNLLKFGHSVEILTTDYSEANRYEEDPITRIGRAMFLPAKGSYYTLPVGINLPFEVRTFLRRHNFDIVHTHGFAPPELSFWAIHYSKSINVCTFHTVNIPKSNKLAQIYQHLFKNCNRKIDGKIAVSRVTQQAIQPFVPGPFLVIPNGVDTNKFNPTVKPLGDFDQQAHKILYVGRLEKRKGLSILLHALPLIKQKIPDLILIVVGKGPEESYYRQLVKDLKITDSVKFTGFVPNDDLPRYYAACDLYCVPTMLPEATSIVILEALATGKPVVASDFPGYRELIGNNENGLLFRPNDPNDLAFKIIRLCSSNELKKTLIEKGLKRAKEFDWCNIAKRIEAVYQELRQSVDFKKSILGTSIVKQDFSLVKRRGQKGLSHQEEKKKNICILYSSRKGGHRFPAEGLAEYLKVNYADRIDCQVFNLLDYTTIGSRLDEVARLGDLLLPKIWRQGYQYLESNRTLFTRLARLVLGFVFANSLPRVLSNNRFDLILSFQPEVNAIFSLTRKGSGQDFVTAIVDYSAHSLWVQDCVKFYYVGNNFVAERLKALGVSDDKIKITGIPQKLSFLNVQKIPIAEQRKLFNLDPNLPTITVMGGFLGKMVDYPAIIKSVSQADFQCQLLVVFGKNKKAFIQCQPLIAKAPITIKPFVALPDVAGVMWAADIIITKPGAVTIAEALTLGKPMILLTPKAGSAQELTFAQYIQKAGAGLHITQTEFVGSQIKHLFENPQELAVLVQRAYDLGTLNRTATQLIAQSILSHLGLT